jgi:hypothetical protein
MNSKRNLKEAAQQMGGLRPLPEVCPAGWDCGDSPADS